MPLTIISLALMKSPFLNLPLPMKTQFLDFPLPHEGEGQGEGE